MYSIVKTSRDYLSILEICILYFGERPAPRESLISANQDIKVRFKVSPKSVAFSITSLQFIKRRYYTAIAATTNEAAINIDAESEPAN